MIHTDAGYYTPVTSPGGAGVPSYMHVWYLKDHLGNNRVLADGGGNALAVQDYAPYGDGMSAVTTVSLSPFPSGASGSPYRYGGKEWGVPTSTYDFEARQFSPSFHRFTSMDPLAEKYYSISPYTYCADDPVNLVDPEGKDWYTDNDTGYYTWFDGNDDHENYTYYGKKGSILGEMEDIMDSFMINTLRIESMYSNGFSFEIASSEKGVFSNKDDDGFFNEFRKNKGPEFSIILQNNKMTQDLMKSPVAFERDSALQEYHSLGMVKGTSKWSILDVFTHDNLTRQFVGSYTYLGKISSGGNYVYNMVFDSKSRHSYFLHIPQSVRRNESSRFGNTYQFYVWVSSRK